VDTGISEAVTNLGEGEFVRESRSGEAIENRHLLVSQIPSVDVTTFRDDGYLDLESEWGPLEVRTDLTGTATSAATMESATGSPTSARAFMTRTRSRESCQSSAVVPKAGLASASR
jgi:hypothetical protein